MSKKTVKMIYDGKEIELPILEGTIGPKTVDISSLHKEFGLFTYDPGFKNTSSCKSKITYIDGNESILRYYGYPIEQLAEQSTYLETCYLLLNGELPSQDQCATFHDEVTHHTMLNEQLIKFYNGFRRDAHPMSIVVGVFGALSSFYSSGAIDYNNSEEREKATMRMIAKMPTIAACAYKYSMGQPFMYPINNLDYTSNFLQMCFAVPPEPFQNDPILSKALDQIFILQADHEQNASTSTVRLASSSQANPYACVAAGVVSLWGPAHGGANEAALNMLKEIGSVKNIPKFIERAKDKTDPFRLMGFGHRVYKTYDPRAKIIQETCNKVLDHLNIEDPLFDIARELEHVALNDEYFISRNLYPNVDFYSGITLRALGFPSSMFTVLFALSRTVGWVSQWKEMITDKEQSIGRPRQLYTGPDKRDYIPMSQRR